MCKVKPQNVGLSGESKEDAKVVEERSRQKSIEDPARVFVRDEEFAKYGREGD